MEPSVSREQLLAAMHSAFSHSPMPPVEMDKLLAYGLTTNQVLVGVYYDNYGNQCPLAATGIDKGTTADGDYVTWAIHFDRAMRDILPPGSVFFGNGVVLIEED